MPEASSGGQQVLWVLRHTDASCPGGAGSPGTAQGSGSAPHPLCYPEGCAPGAKARGSAADSCSRRASGRNARTPSDRGASGGHPASRQARVSAHACPCPAESGAPEASGTPNYSLAWGNRRLYRLPGTAHRSHRLRKEAGWLRGKVD
jgi:hypothetical protein